MNKKEFVQFLAKHNNITQNEASATVDRFTNGIVPAYKQVRFKASKVLKDAVKK